MATQNYSTVPSRNLIKAAKKYLLHAEPITVLGDFGEQHEMPLNSTDTLVFRRYNPVNMQANGAPNITVSDYVLAEGTTPTPTTIGYTDIPVVLQNYGILYKFSSKVEYMYEDNVPDHEAKQTGETMGEVAELIRYGEVKGGTVVYYANGASRSAVNTAISLNKIRLAARALENARGKRITSKLKAGPDFGTSPVEASYLVFIHSDLEADVRNLPGFTKQVEYAAGKQIHAREIGAVEQFRFITSPLFRPFLGAGASASGSGMVSAGGTNVDVYPVIIMAENAWANVALKGMGSATARIISSKEINHANPLGLFGYVGGSFWVAAKRTNENWLVRLETAATDLAT